MVVSSPQAKYQETSCVRANGIERSGPKYRQSEQLFLEEGGDLKGMPYTIMSRHNPREAKPNLSIRSFTMLESRR